MIEGHTSRPKMYGAQLLRVDHSLEVSIGIVETQGSSAQLDHNNKP
jgi:hypothetical protein